MDWPVSETRLLTQCSSTWQYQSWSASDGLRKAVCKIGGRGGHEVELRAKSVGVLCGKKVVIAVLVCYSAPERLLTKRHTDKSKVQFSGLLAFRTPKDVGAEWPRCEAHYIEAATTENTTLLCSAYASPRPALVPI